MSVRNFGEEELPPGQRDQLDAATADVARVFAALTPEGGTSSELGAARARLVFQEHVTAWLAEGSRHCAHLDGRPQPALLLMHERVARCLSCCAEAATATRGTDEDRTCDRCGGVFNDGLYPVAWGAGPLILTGGLCDACHAWCVGEAA